MPDRSGKNQKKPYCCLDIETSDFDPVNGEILELGMVFFEVSDDEIKITREWESTFFASKPVPPRILALTNINPEELEHAPHFSEKRDEIQELVRDCIIVGHNISFDTNFLRAYGIEFAEGASLDTLDLAQFILPTIKTYNLEALMAHFDITYKNAHRALADTKATIRVLEKMIQVFTGFPKTLQESLRTLFANGDPYIADMLRVALLPLPESARGPKAQQKITLNRSKEIDKAFSNERSIVSFPLAFPYQEYAYGAVKASKEKTLLVVSNEQQAYRLWEQGMAMPWFDPRLFFSAEKFAKALEAPQDHKERLFLAKIMVWKETNWQSEVLVGVNLSFYGNQYRSMVCAEPSEAERVEQTKKVHVLVMDYDTFLRTDTTPFASRHLVVFDINNFEAALTRAVNRKASWNDFTYTFNDTSERKPEQEEMMQQALADTDLFFGLLLMQVQKISGETSHLLLTVQLRSDDRFAMIEKAAANFIIRLHTLNRSIDSDRLARLIESVEKFFAPEEGFVYWFEMYKDSCSLHYGPVTLTMLSAEKLAPFAKITFCASLGSLSLLNYFQDRIALQRFTLMAIGQQELRSKINVSVSKNAFDERSLLTLLETVQYPAAILLPNMTAVQSFYEKNFAMLRDSVRVFAQNYSGSTNKLLENFSFEEKSLLIATDKFVLKQAGKKLRVKTLVLCRLPFEQFSHPFIAAQSQRYANPFDEFTIPRTLHNLHSLIGFFYSADLQRIYLADSKINKEYGKYFLEYLQTIPFVETEFF
jgi:DNA polymerase III epsilon subunit-like protein